MLEIVVDSLAVRVGPRFAVTFQRTLRVPDAGETFPLPPGLGVFPLFRVEDYAERLPTSWRERGGVFIPMYQREAMWLGFHGARWKPNAVVVTLGGINAVSGRAGDLVLTSDPQDYVVCPDQPWLDGVNSGRGTVRQFVALPMGAGHTIEAAITGAETEGGLQITVYEPKSGRFPNAPPLAVPHSDVGPMAVVQPMGLGAGGTLKQKIYRDPYGAAIWDPSNRGTLHVHILDSEQFQTVTGLEPPPSPVDAALYATHGLPWFDLYDEHNDDVAPARELTEARTIAQRDAELGRAPDQRDTVDPDTLPVLKISNGSMARREQGSSATPCEDNGSSKST